MDALVVHRGGARGNVEAHQGGGRRAVGSASPAGARLSDAGLHSPASSATSGA